MVFYLLHIGLMLMLLMSALGLIFTRNLLSMAMLFGLYSFQVAGIFILLDAPDVAFTEAAVGTGISTVLMLATLSATRVSHAKKIRRFQAKPAIVCFLMGALLIYGTHDLNNLGDVESTNRQGTAEYYIENAQQETGVPNLVTAVLASYRGFDTLGEVTVVLTAGIAVLMLLGNRRKPKRKVPSDA